MFVVLGIIDQGASANRFSLSSLLWSTFRKSDCVLSGTWTHIMMGGMYDPNSGSRPPSSQDHLVVCRSLRLIAT